MHLIGLLRGTDFHEDHEKFLKKWSGTFFSPENQRRDRETDSIVLNWAADYHISLLTKNGLLDTLKILKTVFEILWINIYFYITLARKKFYLKLRRHTYIYIHIPFSWKHLVFLITNEIIKNYLMPREKKEWVTGMAETQFEEFHHPRKKVINQHFPTFLGHVKYPNN